MELFYRLEHHLISIFLITKNNNFIMSIQRIRIIGAPGAGKTYLANWISDNLNLGCLDLDNICYKGIVDGKPQFYTEQNRIKSLHFFLTQDKWVIEGCYYRKWVMPTFAQADLILLLNIPGYIRNFHVIRRSIKKQYSFRTLARHLKYSYLWEEEHEEKAFKTIESFYQKVRVVNSFQEAIQTVVDTRSCSEPACSGERPRFLKLHSPFFGIPG